MDMIRTSSTNIAAVGYDQEKKVLGIRFNSGGTYHYAGVPEELYESFKKSPSLGRFFHANIKNNYKHRKVNG